MEFFSITRYGFQETFKPYIRHDYIEPRVPRVCLDLKSKEVKDKLLIDCIHKLDDFEDNVDGYAYNSWHRLKRLQKKNIYKPVGPYEMYTRPLTRCLEYGFWIKDPALQNAAWVKSTKNFSKEYSPQTRFANYALSIDKNFRL